MVIGALNYLKKAIWWTGPIHFTSNGLMKDVNLIILCIANLNEIILLVSLSIECYCTSLSGIKLFDGFLVRNVDEICSEKC